MYWHPEPAELVDRRGSTGGPVNGAAIWEVDSEIIARENCLASYVRTVHNIKKCGIQILIANRLDSLDICLLRDAIYSL